MSFTVGLDEADRMAQIPHPDAKVTNMSRAVLTALKELGVTKVAVVTPYIDELNESLMKILEEHGLNVVSFGGMGLSTDKEITEVDPEYIKECVKLVDVPEADGFLICCGGFRVCAPGFLDEVEAVTGRPVAASIQATIWHMLRLGGVKDQIDGFGTLFRKH
mmetsp:Transcript_18482/g.43389  ORF Transcript_18482/g.43389 Transcript_18482/m.43389 type:complete len:162 (-) Transcript_18482:170-655(-)